MSVYSVLCKHNPHDRTVYIAERDLPDSRMKIIRDIANGSLDRVQRVYELHLDECRSEDISRSVALDVALVLHDLDEEDIPRGARTFIEEHCGVGSVLRAAS